MADETPVASLPAALAYTLGGDQGVRNPELAEKYRGEHKASASKFALDYEDVMSKRQAEIENAKRILDETSAALRAGHTGAGPGQMNLPLLQMAAGFFKPTRSGNFGEEFGNALSGLAGGIGNQRMRDDEFNRGMADLTLKRSSFEQEPLKDRAALLKAQQLAEEQAQRAIETAQVKTGPTEARNMQPRAVGQYIYDPRDDTLTDPVMGTKFKMGQQPGGDAALVDPNNPKAAGEAQGRDEEYLKSLPPGVSEQVKALVEGRMAFPSGAAMRSPRMVQLLQMVGRYDPTFDAVNYGARAATQKDFTSGKMADAVLAANKLIGHLGELHSYGAALGNTRFPLVNQGVNAAISAVGRDPATNFNAAKSAVADEAAKFFKGSQATDTEIKTWQAKFDAAQSPEQLQGAIEAMHQLMHSQLEAMAERKSKGLGKQFSVDDLLDKDKQKTLQFVLNNRLDTKEGLQAAKDRLKAHSTELKGAPKQAATGEAPPVPGARKAPDGHWYVANPAAPGKYLRVD